MIYGKENKYDKKNKIIKRSIISIIVLTSIIFVFQIAFKNTEVEALSKYGSRGEEVRQIQTKLKRWGYYKGNIDGIYGSQTQDAVRYFQRKNGLAVDGIAGPNTLKAMGIFNSSNSSSSSSTNNSNVNLLARLIYGEARGEPYTRTSSSWSSGYE